MHRSLKWLGALLLALPLMAMLWIAVFGWNWARGPLQRFATERTGRALTIGGDLEVSLGWPAPRVRAGSVSFANPTWAKEKQLVAMDEAEISVDLLQLLRGKLVFPEVHLIRPAVFLELAADGRKTWLLDLEQSDEAARIPIGRLTLDRGRLGYDDARQKTSIRAEISSLGVQAGGSDAAGVTFSAKGLYKGLALAAHGSGGSVLALYDESAPYPLKLDATVGHTGVKADGTVTSLLKFSAIDMHLALNGDSLARLFPLLGLAVPETHPYAVSGRMLHSGQIWRYEKISGHFGKSDIAGTMQLATGGARPFMAGDMVSQLLDVDDLGPLIGANQRHPLPTGEQAQRGPRPAAGATAVVAAPAPAAVADLHVLPDVPFKSDRWASVDADISLRAKTIARAKELPLENLVTHLKMKDSVLTLDPLDFGIAGGHLKAVISLDGQRNPIEARARISARRISLAKLFPTVKLAKASVGQMNGDFDLTGKGNSVGRMLATADGRIGLIVENGEISKLLMEELGLHLLEIMHLKIAGDRTIKLRCAVADFGVKGGLMTVNALVLDTEVSSVVGSGSIDLGQEKLDLTLVPKTRSTSPVALRSPIYVRGTLSKPEVDVDKGRVAVRGAGALALGLLNPLLTLIPLVEMGPGIDSQCARLIHDAHTPNVSIAPRVTAPIASI